MKTLEVIFETLDKPTPRIAAEYLLLQQKKSGYSLKAFIELLNDGIKNLEAIWNEAKTDIKNKSLVDIELHSIPLNGRQFPLTDLNRFKKYVDLLNEIDNPSETSSPDIEDYIKCLSGKKNGVQLLSKKDYEYLLDLTKELVETKKAPKKIKAIERNGVLPFTFINRTYYKLHSAVEGKRINNEWIKFLQQVFKNYTDSEETSLKKNFNKYPKNSDYEADKKLITDY
jgi:hypothetical protein